MSGLQFLFSPMSGRQRMSKHCGVFSCWPGSPRQRSFNVPPLLSPFLLLLSVTWCGSEYCFGWCRAAVLLCPLSAPCPPVFCSLSGHREVELGKRRASTLQVLLTNSRNTAVLSTQCFSHASKMQHCMDCCEENQLCLRQTSCSCDFSKCVTRSQPEDVQLLVYGFYCEGDQMLEQVT